MLKLIQNNMNLNSEYDSTQIVTLYEKSKQPDYTLYQCALFTIRNNNMRIL